MQLERLAVQLRVRNPWEAMDLGFAMARAWMPQVYGAWLAAAVPLFALCLALLPPPWAAMVLWWLKPALDRVVLHVLGSGVFGDLPTVRAALRALPRALTPGLLASLTWLRFAPARSFNLAVWQLEHQHGAAARARRRQLQRRVGGNAVWLTAVCLHFELALGISIVALYDLLVPVGKAGSAELFELFYGNSPLTSQWTMALAYFAVVTVLEPAYVAAGFSLYLSRRTALEGWDLELALRRMDQRLSAVPPAQRAAAPPQERVEAPAPATARSARGALAVLFCAAAILALGSPPSRAQALAADQSAAPASARDPAAEIKKVYEHPELNPYAERTTLEYLGPEEKRQRRAEHSPWGDMVSEMAAEALRILAWAVLGVVLALLAYHLLRRLERSGPRADAARVPPATLFGLDVRPEALPADPAVAAARLAREGRILAALSLLYRGALATLLHRDGVELAGGDTESDCLRKSQARVPEAAHRYFAGLLAAWQHAAYAHREVPQSEVEALCRDWPLHFGPRAEAGSAR